MTEAPTAQEIRITRVFDAPRELVWKAWTEPEHLAQWWGPRGRTTPVDSITLDLRPGGELWLVYNTHLPYRSTLRTVIGRPELITQDQGYLVTRSRRPD
jgi:uncharacterized protein YndB with AHSA1/START domain